MSLIETVTVEILDRNGETKDEDVEAICDTVRECVDDAVSDAEEKLKSLGFDLTLRVH